MRKSEYDYLWIEEEEVAEPMQSDTDYEPYNQRIRFLNGQEKD